MLQGLAQTMDSEGCRQDTNKIQINICSNQPQDRGICCKHLCSSLQISLETASILLLEGSIRRCKGARRGPFHPRGPAGWIRLKAHAQQSMHGHS